MSLDVRSNLPPSKNFNHPVKDPIRSIVSIFKMPPKRLLRRNGPGCTTRSLSPPHRKSRDKDNHNEGSIKEAPSKKARTWKDKHISFEYSDLEGFEVPHNDPIGINVTIYNYLVKRAL